MTTIDELEIRVRELASEVEGEKAVTRQVYQQAVRNGDLLRAVQIATAEVASRVDHMVQEVVQNSALLRTHGLRLEALTRDVAQMRTDLTVLRREMGELEGHIDTRFDAVMEAIRALTPRERS
jgi:chromosome segregation ATPase